jgi:hypothetical protein
VKRLPSGGLFLSSKLAESSVIVSGRDWRRTAKAAGQRRLKAASVKQALRFSFQPDFCARSKLDEAN